jgi:hypothetical protein
LRHYLFFPTAFEPVHDDEILLRRVEFDRLTDLLRARTVEPDSAAQVEHHVDKTETRTRIDGTGGSTSHGMAVDHSPPANVRSCFSHAISFYVSCKSTNMG